MAAADSPRDGCRAAAPARAAWRAGSGLSRGRGSFVRRRSSEGVDSAVDARGHGTLRVGLGREGTASAVSFHSFHESAGYFMSAVQHLHQLALSHDWGQEDGEQQESLLSAPIVSLFCTIVLGLEEV